MGAIYKHDIERIINKYNIENYVETGTGMGSCLYFMMKFNLKEFHSIEIHPKMYEIALNNFKDNNCNLYLGNSSEVLCQILKNIHEPTLFFLDAHFPGADYGLADYSDEKDKNKRIPLEQELITIKQSKNTKKDVIIIDDLRIYEDGPFEEGNWDQRHVLGDNGIEFIYDLYKDTHNIEKIYYDHGYVILYPKDTENKTCEINQPLGLGDILLCEPIANYYYKKGFDINFLIKDDFMWIKEYINYINFINDSNHNTEPIFEKNYIYLPLIYKKISNDENFKKGGWLYDKYTTSRLDQDLWKTFNFNRNLKKENDLFDLLNLNNKKYILVNGNHSLGTRNLQISSEHHIISMNYIKGYTMLDWCKVIENAEEVHTVSTSILYPLIKLNHKNVTIYDRNYKGDGTKETIVEVFKEYNFQYE